LCEIRIRSHLIARFFLCLDTINVGGDELRIAFDGFRIINDK
jgi:hypothetical protein